MMKYFSPYKKYIYALLTIILLWLWFTKTADVALSVHSPFTNKLRVQVKAVGVSNFIKPVIVLEKSNGLDEVCRIEPNVTYDCAYDIDTDFKSITWLGEEKFEIRVMKNGRVHRVLGKEIFVYDTQCREIDFNKSVTD